jgi:hypothetical protein
MDILVTIITNIYQVYVLSEKILNDNLNLEIVPPILTIPDASLHAT